MIQDMNFGLIFIIVSGVLLSIIGIIFFLRKELPPFKTVLISGTPKQIKCYLETGEVSLASRDEFGITPLMTAAAYNKNPKVVSLLLKAGAGVHERDNEGYTALFHAIKNNAPLKILDLLVKRGAKTDDRTNDGLSAVRKSFWKTKREKRLWIMPRKMMRFMKRKPIGA